MAEGGFDYNFDNSAYDARIEEEETYVDVNPEEDPVGENPEQSPYSIHGYSTEKLRRMTVEDAVNSYYEKLEEMGQGKPTMLNPSEFTLRHGKFRLRRYPDVRLIKANGEPLQLNTIRSRYGAEVIRKGLGFSRFGFKPRISNAKNESFLKF